MDSSSREAASCALLAASWARMARVMGEGSPATAAGSRSAFRTAAEAPTSLEQRSGHGSASMLGVT